MEIKMEKWENGKAHIDTKGDILGKDGDFSLRSKGNIEKCETKGSPAYR